MEIPDEILQALKELFGGGGTPSLLCPACGGELDVRGGMHSSGTRADGTRWTGGADYAFCQTCSQWFKRVFSPERPPPGAWQKCDPPNDSPFP
jgi:hypothetical protein